MMCRIALVALLFSFAVFAQHPVFSDQLLEIPVFNGLSGVYETPAAADVDNDVDIDLVFVENDQSLIWFENIGNDSSFQFQRHDGIFEISEPLYEFPNSLRFQDYNDDGAVDITYIRQGSNSPVGDVVLGHRAVRGGVGPHWTTVSETLFINNKNDIGDRLLDYVLIDLIGDATQEVVIPRQSSFTASPVELYKFVADTLQEVVGYFDGVLEDQVYNSRRGRMRPFFVQLQQDSLSGLLINHNGGIPPFFSSYYSYYQNDGSRNTPQWELTSLPIGDNAIGGHVYPLLKKPDASGKMPVFYEDWTSSNGGCTYPLFSHFVPDVDFSGSGAPSNIPYIWMKGRSTRFDDLAAFDHNYDGKSELLFLSNSSVCSSFGPTSVYFYQLLASFSTDPLPQNVPFLDDFKPLTRGGYDWWSASFALGDLDADGDTDLLEVNRRYEKVIWNSGSDSIPDWVGSAMNLEIPEKWYYPSLKDFNNDNLLDLVMANDSATFYFENLGNQFLPQYPDSGYLLAHTGKVHSAFADFDEDGDLDMIGGNRYYQNIFIAGQALSFMEIDSLLPVYDSTAAIEFVDPDDDGDQDIVVLLGDGQLFLVRNTSPMAISESNQPLAKASELSNFPNPFNNSTVIRFYLPTAQFAQLNVYDILGRMVVTLAAKKFTAGWHEIDWAGESSTGIALPSGNYYLRLISDGETFTHQIQIIR